MEAAERKVSIFNECPLCTHGHWLSALHLADQHHGDMGHPIDNSANTLNIGTNGTVRGSQKRPLHFTVNVQAWFYLMSDSLTHAFNVFLTGDLSENGATS